MKDKNKVKKTDFIKNKAKRCKLIIHCHCSCNFIKTTKKYTMFSFKIPLLFDDAIHSKVYLQVYQMVHIVHILVIQSGFVTVRVSLKCSRFNHAFAVYQLVLLGLLFCLNGVILCLPHNVIGLAYGGLTSFGQRFLYVVQNVLSRAVYYLHC